MATTQEKKSAPNEAKNPAQVAADASQIVIKVDKEHMKRHDEAEKRDKELAAMLQANWARRVETEHRPN